jgi:membrane-bound lytic murein transglycosylase A
MIKPGLRLLLFFGVGALLGSAATMVLMRPSQVVQDITPPPPAAPKIYYEPRTFDDLKGWGGDRVADVIPAFAKSCARIKDDDEPITLGLVVVTAADRKKACAAVLDAGPSAKDIQAAIEGAYQPLSVIAEGKPEGMFTGYYEAALRGSLQREGAYQHPLYGVPKSLINVSLKDFVSPAALEGSDVPKTIVGRIDGRQLKPFFTREDIDLGNAIAEDSDVIAWIDDPVDVLVLHIQGSGQVTLPDGQVMRVGFAGHNGHTFRGLGRILIDEGALPQGTASMIAVRSWLKENPKRAQELMVQNARYIFFRRIEGEGPIGAAGVALTAGRSIAVDPRYVPLGSLLWLDSIDPDRTAIRRLVMAQDTGAAILGGVRGDYYWGSGEAAFTKAARMRSPGRYDILVPRASISRPGGGV